MIGVILSVLPHCVLSMLRNHNTAISINKIQNPGLIQISNCVHIFKKLIASMRMGRMGSFMHVHIVFNNGYALSPCRKILQAKSFRFIKLSEGRVNSDLFKKSNDIKSIKNMIDEYYAKMVDNLICDTSEDFYMFFPAHENIHVSVDSLDLSDDCKSIHSMYKIDSNCPSLIPRDDGYEESVCLDEGHNEMNDDNSSYKTGEYFIDRMMKMYVDPLHEYQQLPGLNKLLENKKSKQCDNGSQFNYHMVEIYNKVFATKMYNYQQGSGLNLDAWRLYLQEYRDSEILEFLEYGWPSNFRHGASLQSTFGNHNFGRDYGDHIDCYLNKELSERALLGPFGTPPTVPIHLSPIITRPKSGSDTHRIVVGLSLPRLFSINDSILNNENLGAPIHMTLPTNRVRQLGPGCSMYKLDLSIKFKFLYSTLYSNKNSLGF